MSELCLEDLLFQYFEQKQAKNSRYSLRALSQFLDMEPSFVSKIIRKKYKLNTRIIRHIAARIGLDQPTTEKCIEINNQVLLGRNFASIDDKIFAQIARWETFVILRYLDIDPLLNTKFLADKLDLEESEVQKIIQDLIRLELLKQTPAGTFQRQQERYLISNETLRSDVNKGVTKDYILKSLESVDKNPIDERIHMTSVFSIKKSTYEVIKTKIHDFAMEVSRYAQEDAGSEEQVMIVNLNFFPVIKDIPRSPSCEN